MGLGLVAVGATLATLVFANWSYILSVTKNSVAAAAGGAAGAVPGSQRLSCLA